MLRVLYIIFSINGNLCLFPFRVYYLFYCERNASLVCYDSSCFRILFLSHVCFCTISSPNNFCHFWMHKIFLSYYRTLFRHSIHTLRTCWISSSDDSSYFWMHKIFLSYYRSMNISHVCFCTISSPNNFCYFWMHKIFLSYYRNFCHSSIHTLRTCWTSSSDNSSYFFLISTRSFLPVVRDEANRH